MAKKKHIKTAIEEKKGKTKSSTTEVKVKTKPVKRFSFFRLLKSRYFVFFFLTIVSATAVFCLFLLDETNGFRHQYMPWLDNNFFKSFISNLKILYGKTTFNVTIVSWAIIIGIAIFIFAGFLVWAFFTPIKKKVVDENKYEKKVLNKRATAFNIIFFTIIAIILGALIFLFIKFVLNSQAIKDFEWYKKYSKDYKGPLDEILTVLKTFGIVLGLYLVPIIALLLLMLVFKILVALFVLFAGSVSKGVMKTQGYQEALATSQIVNARLQEETMKEMDTSAKIIVPRENTMAVANMLNARDYEHVPTNQAYPNPGYGNGGGSAPMIKPEIVFPALINIDNKYKGKKEAPIKSVSFNSKPTIKKGAKEVKLTPQNDPNNHIKDLAIRFQAFLANKNDLYFGLDIIRAFIAGLNASRMILLEGLSGTGKTTLPRVFNEFVGGKSSFFPVQATWRDRSDIVGYFSDFTKQFKETEFLKTLYEASYTPERFNIMVLDEMNISRVEYYFADFLSVMEYPEQDWLIPLINSADLKHMPKNLVDGKISIPSNTWFVGTINVDDSTFTVSDKVYDRVIVLDFKELSVPFKCKCNDEPWHMSPKELLDNFKYITKQDLYHLTKSEKDRFSKLCIFASDTFDIRFGNRVVNQIYNFVPIYVALGGSKIEGIDFMFARKILRKIDGKYENYISVGLTKLSKYLQTLYGKGKFKETEAYIEKLRNKLS